MQTTNAGLVIFWLVVILVGSNLLMLGMAWNARGGLFGGFKSGSDLTNPWKKQQDELGELSRRVKNLPPRDEKEDE